MIRVVVIGLDLEGLAASWAFRQHPQLEVWTVGHESLGGDCANLRPIMHTESAGNLLREVRVPYASYGPRSGILLGGSVQRYPDALTTHLEKAERIFNDWQRKAGLPITRLNGELKHRPRPRRLRCEHEELVNALTKGANIIETERWRLEPGTLLVDGRCLDYDFAVLTAPLWECCSRVWFPLPNIETTMRTTAVVSGPKATRFRQWDRVLTPYTPECGVYEVTDHGGQYSAVLAGEGSIGVLLSDLNYLFPGGYSIDSIRRERGRSTPLPKQTRWPENIASLGTRSEWRTALPLDIALDGAYVLMRKWLR